jgi:hypothetical protein
MHQRRGSKFEEQMLEEADGPPSQLPTYRGNVTAAGAMVGPAGQQHSQQQALAPGAGRPEKGANNPFRTQQGGAGASRGVLNNGGAHNASASIAGAAVSAVGGQHDSRPRSSEEVGQAAAAYRGHQQLKSSRSEKDLLTDDAEFVPAHQIPPGNLLTAMRNESTPGLIPPGSRTKTPKSPSPKKMDQILQRDLINKRRFQIQQQAAEGGEDHSTGVAAGAGVGVAGYQNTRANRNSFPSNYGMAVQEMNAQVNQHSVFANNRSHSAAPEHYNTHAHGAPPPQALQVNRFGKLIPAAGAGPFPTIASRMTNSNNNANNGNNIPRASVRRTNPITGAPIGMSSSSNNNSNSDLNNINNNQQGGSANNPSQMHHSSAMLHSGSNIINSEYSNQY